MQQKNGTQRFCGTVYYYYSSAYVFYFCFRLDHWFDLFPSPTHPARASMVARILTCLTLTLPIVAGFLGRSMSPARLGVPSGSKSSLHMAAPTEVVIIGCGCPKRGMVRLARTGHAPTVIPAVRSLSSCPTRAAAAAGRRCCVRAGSTRGSC